VWATLCEQKMKTSLRICLGILLPAPIGVLVLSLVNFIVNGSSKDAFTLNEFLFAMTFGLFVTYILIGIQSIIWSYLMECFSLKKYEISGSKWHYYGYGAFFGFLAALPVLFGSEEFFRVILPTGALTGFAVAVILSLTFSSHNQALKAQPSAAGTPQSGAP
jgi:hypothetical protein